VRWQPARSDPDPPARDLRRARVRPPGRERARARAARGVPRAAARAARPLARAGRAMSDLRLEGRFGRGDFVGEVELEVRAGEVVAVLGPNGAGKSSLLRTVAGFDPLHTGRLLLGDDVLDDGARRVPPEERRVGTVFQDHRLF